MARAAILLVSSQQKDAEVVRTALEDEGLHVLGVRSYREAMFALAKEVFSAVLCNDALPDGSWQDILGQIVCVPAPPRLILISSSFSPAQWAEAINLGAYDVLLRPLNTIEIQRVTMLASEGLPAMKAQVATA